MNAIDFLKKQHRKVDELFEQCEKASEQGEDVQGIVRELCDNLVIHTKIEHDVFYPVLKKHAETKEIVLEGLEEHHLVQIVLKQLASLDASDETYKAKLTVLKELVKHHVEEEEKEMFKQAKQILDEGQLERLGKELERQTEDYKSQEPQFTVTMLREVRLETTK